MKLQLVMATIGLVIISQSGCAWKNTTSFTANSRACLDDRLFTGADIAKFESLSTPEYKIPFLWNFDYSGMAAPVVELEKPESIAVRSKSNDTMLFVGYVGDDAEAFWLRTDEYIYIDELSFRNKINFIATEKGLLPLESNDVLQSAVRKYSAYNIIDFIIAVRKAYDCREKNIASSVSIEERVVLEAVWHMEMRKERELPSQVDRLQSVAWGKYQYENGNTLYMLPIDQFNKIRRGGLAAIVGIMTNTNRDKYYKYTVVLTELQNKREIDIDLILAFPSILFHE